MTTKLKIDMYNRYKSNLKWSYRKNMFDISGLVLRKYPDFILTNNCKSCNDEIPVFVFHSLTVETFTEQLEFLHKNGYCTLDSNELYEILTKQKQAPTNAVVLTFDDGYGSLWTIGYPLLKKYGLKAISFLVPGLIKDVDDYYPNLEDVWKGESSIQDLVKRDESKNPLATWKEIEIIHKSGVIDFQAHSMYHNLIFTSSKVIDFIHPNFDYYRFGNITVPVYHQDGEDVVDRNAALGMPLYESDPRLFHKPRFYDNEELRKKCIDYVEKNGDEEFFKKSGWRYELLNYYQRQSRKLENIGYYEKFEEQANAIYSDLAATKKQIETRLEGKQVNHLCYPWFLGSKTALDMSKKAGYLSNFWGTIFNRKTNYPGCDPYYISRIEDSFIYRLPGIGRKSLKELMSIKLGQYFPNFMKRMMN